MIVPELPNAYMHHLAENYIKKVKSYSGPVEFTFRTDNQVSILKIKQNWTLSPQQSFECRDITL